VILCLAGECGGKLRERFPKLAALMDNAEDDVPTFMGFPNKHWPQLASSNSLGRLNKELKRRSRALSPDNPQAQTLLEDQQAA
jgi:transposase-like protein